MTKYRIILTQTRTHDFEVVADTVEAAYDLAEAAYEDEARAHGLLNAARTLPAGA